MAEDIDKDKAKEAVAGQPQRPEVPLTPDQQQSQAEKADASAAAATGGPEAGLGELADANPVGTPDGGQNTWEPQPQVASDEYNADLDPMVQRAMADPKPEFFLGKPMSPQTRAAIEKIVEDRKSSAGGGGQPPENDAPVGGTPDGDVSQNRDDAVQIDGGVIKVGHDDADKALGAIGKGIVESRVAKVDEYRQRIEAVHRGEELTPGDKDDIRNLTQDYIRLGGKPFEPGSISGGIGGPPENGVPTNGTPDGDDGDKNEELSRLAGNLEAVAQQQEVAEGSSPKTAVDSSSAAEVEGDADKSPAGLTSEAEDLVRSVDAGGVPAFVTPNLERIARDNGIDPEGKTPQQITDELRAKGGPGSEQAEDGATIPEQDSGTTPIDAEPNTAPNPDNVSGSEPEPATTEPETAEEKYRRMMERKSPEGRHKQAEKLRKDIARAEKKMDRLTTLPDQDALQVRIDSLQDQLEIIEEVQSDEGDEKFASAAKGEKDKEDDFASNLDAEIEDFKKLAGKSFEALNDELVSEENTITGLKAKLAKAKGAERDVIQKKINDAEARKDVIEGFRLEKEKGYLTDKNAEAIAEAEKRRRELSDPADLKKGIDESKTQLEGLDGQILALETRIDKLDVGSDEWKELNHQKLELSRQANKLRDKLKLDEEALKAADEKKRKESGTGDKPTLENIKRESVGDYLAMSPEDRKNYLRSVSEVLPTGKYDFVDINRRATAGEAITIEERAYLSNEISRRLLNKKGEYDPKCLPKLAAQYPEVFGLVTDKILASKAAESFRRENFPTGWEKMLDFAKKNPQLLALLLAMIVGTGVAMAGPATSAAGLGSFLMR